MTMLLNENEVASPQSAPEMRHEDDEESSQLEPHAALVDEVRQGTGAQREAMAYLLRYETMVRQQEAEDMATLEHVRPCIERLQDLAGIEPSFQNNNSNNNGANHSSHRASDTAFLSQEISFADLRKAMQALDNATNMEFFKTDRQFMMVLRILTSKAHEVEGNVTITWAEFVQCYKTCIVGMMVLQHLSSSSANRSRARDRTLTMLSLFETPSTKLFHEEKAPIPIDSAALDRSRRGGANPRQRRQSLTVYAKPRNLHRFIGALLFLGVLGYTRFLSPDSSLRGHGSFFRRSNRSVSRHTSSPLGDSWRSRLQSSTPSSSSSSPVVSTRDDGPSTSIPSPSSTAVSPMPVRSLVVPPPGARTWTRASAIAGSATTVALLAPLVTGPTPGALLPLLLRASVYGWGTFSFLATLGRGLLQLLRGSSPTTTTANASS
jgi:hypothetical protein